MLKVIEKQDTHLDAHTCPVCDQSFVDDKGQWTGGGESVCEHLVYVAHSEGVELDKENFYNDDDNDGNGTEWEDIINKLDDSNYEAFEFYTPAPSGMCSYMIYKKS